VYEFFEHTADVGLRARAPDLDGLFSEAAVGLFALIVEGPLRLDPERREFDVAGTRHDHLLFDWLNELLYVFDTERLLLGDFEVRVTATGVHASARGRVLDSERDHLLHEVKAITYHGLKVERHADGWQAELIVDI